MKRIALLFVFALSVSVLLQAQGHRFFNGTVIKMRMTDCVARRSFVNAMSGVPAQGGGVCPEYTVMSDKVMYVVVGRRDSDVFIPLAENVEFLIRKNELVIMSDDEKTKSHFLIQHMMLRADWDREEARKELAAQMMERSVNYEARNTPLSPIASTGAR